MPTGVYPRTEYHKRINSEGHKGIKLSDLHKKKLSKIFSGRKISDEQKEKLRNSAVKNGIRPGEYCLSRAAESSRLYTGEKNHKWKGNNVGYVGLHSWIARKKGKPKKCEKCKKEGEGRYEWANISGEYRRNVNDFIRLCVVCHKNFDLDSRGRTNKKQSSKICKKWKS